MPPGTCEVIILASTPFNDPSKSEYFFLTSLKCFAIGASLSRLIPVSYLVLLRIPTTVSVAEWP